MGRPAIARPHAIARHLLDCGLFENPTLKENVLLVLGGRADVAGCGAADMLAVASGVALLLMLPQQPIGEASERLQRYITTTSILM